MTGVCKSTYGRGVVGRGSEWSLPHPRACNWHSKCAEQ